MEQRTKIRSFVAGQVTNLSVGYLAGLTASTLVSQYFVKKGIGNLWGLATRRQAISGELYDWLMFGASYAIGLIVMLMASELMARYRNRSARGEAKAAFPEESGWRA